MRVPLAWSNTIQNKWRTLASASGICFAILLIFMQLGFLAAAKKNVSIVYRFLDFDIIITSKGYLSLTRALEINPYRIIQTRNLPGILSATGLLVDRGGWKNQKTNRSKSCMIIGLDSSDASFLKGEAAQQMPLISRPYTTLVDRKSHDAYGSREVGGLAMVNGTPLEIRGEYNMGLGLLADGSIIVNPLTFKRLFGMASNNVHMGLVKVAPGVTPEKAMETIRAALPPDVRMLTRRQIIEREQRYFIKVKPLGIIFQVAAFVGFIIGSVILYQVLSSEISKRLNEFATLKAIGYTNSYLYMVGIKQGLIMSFMGYIPALIFSHFLYNMVESLTKVPTAMGLYRAVFVLLLSLAMCGFASVLALQKVKKADPAELY